MDKDQEYIPDDEEKKSYTLAEAYELLRKQEQENERPSVSQVRDC